MKLDNDFIKVYCKAMGKIFEVQHIANSDEEANDFCEKHRDTGVIAQTKEGLIFIADLYSMTVPSSVLPD